MSIATGAGRQTDSPIWRAPCRTSCRATSRQRPRTSRPIPRSCRTIETEKANLEATDPRMVELAKHAEQLARDIAAKTVAETELVTEANAAAD